MWVRSKFTDGSDYFEVILSVLNCIEAIKLILFLGDLTEYMQSAILKQHMITVYVFFCVCVCGGGGSGLFHIKSHK